ncbi:hypothetical protein DFH08DRAFT_825266 [Mycena albidolilacea]|uniref:Uncharacterized protein n=1 Tax=Mycena albidolilacea TaxID=1033008 RepID=A0AAD6Z2K3_9AGAR|nr:hypothetical protein DFH08DRAFT_825266 [Mycena albidolilacea]
MGGIVETSTSAIGYLQEMGVLSGCFILEKPMQAVVCRFAIGEVRQFDIWDVGPSPNQHESHTGHPKYERRGPHVMVKSSRKHREIHTESPPRLWCRENWKMIQIHRLERKPSSGNAVFGIQSELLWVELVRNVGRIEYCKGVKDILTRATLGAGSVSELLENRPLYVLLLQHTCTPGAHLVTPNLLSLCIILFGLVTPAGTDFT